MAGREQPWARTHPVTGMAAHDLSAGGDVMDRVTGCAARARRAPTAAIPTRHGRAAQRLGERDLPGRRPRRRAFGAARAPARLPHRAGDRVRAGLDGRAARRGRGAHAAGAAGRRRAAGGDGRPSRAARARRPGTASASSSCPAPSRAQSPTEADRPSLRRAGRDHRADAPARPGRGPGRPGSPGSAGTTTAAFGRQARWGRWQDGIGVGPAERAGARPAGRRAGRAAGRRSAPGRSGTAWCTPTPGWPTCSCTTARSASSTSTTPGSAGTCTTSAPR